ncbi:hypothetical protein L6164_017549 [Bauhinia variegata]|uniref:Uncharacterized protein n=1 Tax=Bauhinia variegata TaxID=167791 RepID=A0ACB9N9F9_BAUVA|nr:hypothetical protein L6164_017549 [Bauhinia variegata]
MPPTSMWLKDLDELEKKLDVDLDSKEAEEERRRLSEAKKRATSRGVTLAAKRPPQKNNKRANNVESEAYMVAHSSMDVAKHGLLVIIYISEILRSRQKALADLHQMQTVHIEKLSVTQCQPESQLKFINRERPGYRFQAEWG